MATARPVLFGFMMRPACGGVFVPAAHNPGVQPCPVTRGPSACHRLYTRLLICLTVSLSLARGNCHMMCCAACAVGRCRVGLFFRAAGRTASRMYFIAGTPAQ